MTAIVPHERIMAMLSPMWQRIARGEVDLTQFTDEEIMSGKITMEDGRTLPKPKEFPPEFLREQHRRGMHVAQRKLREGGIKALDYYMEIMDDDMKPMGAKLEAAKFFSNRYLGPADQRIHVTHEHEGRDPRDVLLDRLLSQRTSEAVEPRVVEAEILEDPDEALADLL
jgi:hypothetical protein